ncbi:4Fe-4S dicluster domain-containing protein [Limobrevibacterium gyesilva]|uniref:4Fe-4S dicluster domain-containing protein n=1 Tax=Limobrevibacterium gyesilva TaxID=2991712 RepID=A0AA41YRG8_9PROT|nr:4Fe-4S dicluster domain-containing protein [Limobrevibacterium gyesilva]MCW3474162.1 4Fe-4S dicluster domain-containing protein [Limobrevibacterium gyesilva]
MTEPGDISPKADRIVFACSCENTMPLDTAALRGCGGELRQSDHLCRTRLEAFRAALAEGRPITVGCTQEAPLFQEVADAAGFSDLAFANIREAAGWSDAAAKAGPKMAALLAAASEPMPPAPLVTLRSEGVALIYGRDEIAIAVGRRLADTLDVTVLLTRPGDIVPPALADFPVLKGSIAGAKGHLGAFELKVNDYAGPAVSSRARLAFGPARDGATSRCDLILDLSGDPPLFPAAELRPGYLRADPARPETVERLVFDASRLVGAFDKPGYIHFEAGLCAHQRNRRIGCTRCLDLCPTGAITPAGDHVAIDAAVCAGCGACAAVCPTGAATYALPPMEAVLRRLRRMLLTYRDAGGEAPVLLIHDQAHGQAMIDAAARLGRGLPANLLPLRLNETTQAGLELVASAFAWGAAGLVFLQRGKPRHDTEGLRRTAALAEALLSGMGFAPGSCAILETDDPDALGTIAAQGPATGTPSRFIAMGEGRHLTASALRELHRVAPLQPGPIPLPAGAPFGGLRVDAAGCTLCLACVAACPTGALRDDPDVPTLRFAEDACVQCGLCRATCPEKVIALDPRFDLAAWSAPAVTIKTEEPYSCIKCGRPFGTRSSIERIIAKLQGRHWMFSGAAAQRIDVVRMCEDCRVEAVMNESFDPHAGPARPRPRTAEDLEE